MILTKRSHICITAIPSANIVQSNLIISIHTRITRRIFRDTHGILAKIRTLSNLLPVKVTAALPHSTPIRLFTHLIPYELQRSESLFDVPLSDEDEKLLSLTELSISKLLDASCWLLRSFHSDYARCV
jgi:hypothetical protein